jgi:hypothetical protein
MPPKLSGIVERREVAEMSRKVSIVAVVVVLVLATTVAPAMAAQPGAQPAVQGAAPVQTDAGSVFGASSSVELLPIGLNGDCEGGGSGGCPNPG